MTDDPFDYNPVPLTEAFKVKVRYKMKEDSMTDAETLDAAKEILDEQEEWGATSVAIANLLLARNAALVEANMRADRLAKEVEWLSRDNANNDKDRLHEALAELRAENERLKQVDIKALEQANAILHAAMSQCPNCKTPGGERILADRDRLLASLREQVGYCWGCRGCAILDDGRPCPSCKPARDLIAEYEAKK